MNSPDDPQQDLLPVPETVETFDLLGPEVARVREYLDQLGRGVTAVVTDVVGLSLSMMDGEESLTFTLAISDDDLRLLDAAQYVDGGPCVEAASTDEVFSTTVDDPLDEGRWSMFARAAAHRGVRSSLSIPIHVDHEPVGSLNVYASSAEAFAGRVDDLARLVNASPAEAVRDADLGFTGRDRASVTLDEVRASTTIDAAAGLLALREGISEGHAHARIGSAARRAGVPALDLAMLIIEVSAADEGA